MDLDWSCLYCNEPISPEWARTTKKFCDSSCQMSYWYRLRYKKFYDNRYKRLKREWERSPNGKRAGIPIRVWLKLPKDWR